MKKKKIFSENEMLTNAQMYERLVEESGGGSGYPCRVADYPRNRLIFIGAIDDDIPVDVRGIDEDDAHHAQFIVDADEDGDESVCVFIDDVEDDE
jgi:hypothetical protein